MTRGLDPSRLNRQSRCVWSGSVRTTDKARPSGVTTGEFSFSGVCVTCVSFFVAMSYR